MKRALVLLIGLLSLVVISWRSPCLKMAALSSASGGSVQKFQVTGVLREIKADRRTAVIQHEAISNYMPGMTMFFKVKDTNQLAGLRSGDEVSFRLLVSRDESWIDHVIRLTNGVRLSF